MNGLSVKVAKGEAGTNVAEAVFGNTELLSTVIKYALESNAQAPTLASVAHGWHKQLCFWKQQLVLKTALSKELKAGVQCLDFRLRTAHRMAYIGPILRGVQIVQ